MIKSTYLGKVTHEDFFQIISLALVFLKKENLKELKLEDITAALEKAFNAFDDAFKQARKTGLVELKDEIDSLRDDLIIGFFQNTGALLRFPDSEIKQAAQRIADTINKYGGSAIATQPQKEETASITNMLQEIDEADLTLTNTIRWADRLLIENNRFADIFAQKTEKDAEYIAGLLVDERKKVDEAFRQVCKTIDALAFISGTAPYESVAAKINQLVADAQQAVKQRASARDTARRKKEKMSDDINQDN